MFDWWTGAFVDQLVEPLKQVVVPDFVFFLLLSTKKRVLLSASAKRFGVPRIRDFFILPSEVQVDTIKDFQYRRGNVATISEMFLRNGLKVGF